MSSYTFADAIKVIGLNNRDEKSKLNEKKREFENKYQAFLDTYHVIGDKDFTTTFVRFEDKRYSET
jgi:hypothetical protein